MGTTSGTYVFAPGTDLLAAEAWERAGLDQQVITGEHIKSINRSIGFLMSSWSNRGHRQWKFEQTLNTTIAGTNSFVLPAGTVGVQTVVLRRSNYDTEMGPISREDYLLIPDKTTRGRPDRYFLDRRRDTETNTRLLMTLWPVPENSTDIVVVNGYKQLQDGGAFSNQIDVPFRFQEAFLSDLAARIAQKFKPERFAELRALADVEWKAARGEDEDPGDLVLSVQYGRRGRR